MNSGEPSSKDTSEVLANALEAAKALIGAHSSEATRVAASNTSASNGSRAKIDLGFTAFEKSMKEQLTSGCLNATQGEASWTPEMRQELVTNVTGEFSAGLNRALLPMKQAIGKTWMALPEDEQKDGYVVSLRTGFASTLDANVAKMVKHVQLGLNRVKRLSQKKDKLSSDELLRKSEQTINDNLLADHCYGDKSFLQLDANPNRTMIPNATKKLTHFCITSTVGSMTKRLNDTQNLVSMTMRFDAKAMMSLFQEPQVS